MGGERRKAGSKQEVNVRIVWVGRTKEPYLNEGINRYLKLLKPSSKVSIIEVREERGKGRAGSLPAEGKRILRQTQSYILLDDRGKELTSEGFAAFLKDKESIDFVIGGPYGVSGEVREKARETIALSRMTFTHEMARLILLEQLYRASTIIKGREYHH